MIEGDYEIMIQCVLVKVFERLGLYAFHLKEHVIEEEIESVCW